MGPFLGSTVTPLQIENRLVRPTIADSINERFYEPMTRDETGYMGKLASIGLTASLTFVSVMACSNQSTDPPTTPEAIRQVIGCTQATPIRTEEAADAMEPKSATECDVAGQPVRIREFASEEDRNAWLKTAAKIANNVDEFPETIISGVFVITVPPSLTDQVRERLRVTGAPVESDYPSIDVPATRASIGQPVPVGDWLVTVTSIDKFDHPQDDRGLVDITSGKTLDRSITVEFQAVYQGTDKRADVITGLHWMFSGADGLAYGGGGSGNPPKIAPNETTKQSVIFNLPQTALDGQSFTVLTAASNGKGVPYLTP